MTINGIKTSPKLASTASKVLRTESAPKDTKSLAGASLGNSAKTTLKGSKSKAPKNPKGKK